MKYLFLIVFALCVGLPSLALIKLGVTYSDMLMAGIGFAVLMSVAVFINSYIAEAS